MKTVYRSLKRVFIKEKILYVVKPTVPNLLSLVVDFATISYTRILTNRGPYVRALEKALISIFRADCVLTSSGTVGLEGVLSFYSQNVLRKEVITTPFTFIATASAVLRAGLRPIFVDVYGDSGQIDLDRVQESINENTCCVLVVAVYGQKIDYEGLRSLSMTHKVPIIVDAAQSFGSLGSDVSDFSFPHIVSLHATKTLNALEGGIIICRDKMVTSYTRSFINFGYNEEGGIDVLGTNGKMSEIQAAIGLQNLKSYERGRARRRRIHNYYCSNLKSSIILLAEKLGKDSRANFGYFPILVEPYPNRDVREELLNWLKHKGIVGRKYFWPLIYEYEYYQKRSSEWGGGNNCKNAKRLSEKVLCLPIYEDMTIRECKYVCAVVNNFFDQHVYS